MTQAFVCTTCGTQYEPSLEPPPRCVICDEERQFVPPSGQAWTTLARLRRNTMSTFGNEMGLTGVSTTPAAGIGQRALIVRTAEGNVLWDCISLIDDTMVEIIKGLGGLKAIAISHPHYYTTMVEWSEAFGGIPVYLHAADKPSVMRSSPNLVFWDEDQKVIAPGVTLLHLGGHFPGSAVMHWAEGAEGKGALLTGDTLQVTMDRKFVSFMWSYPNFMPLGARAVQSIADRLEPWSYDAIYGAFWKRVVACNGKQVVKASVARHLALLSA